MAEPQPPVKGMLYANVPAVADIPLIVMVLDAHTAVKPVGRPVGVPMPVAPVVVCAIWISAEVKFWEDRNTAGEAVFTGVTVMVPVAFRPPQPPVKGML